MSDANERHQRKLEYMREWRRRKIASDPTFLDREAARTKTYWKEHPEQRKAARSRRLAADPEYERRYMRQYKAERREEFRERAKTEYQRRRDQHREYHRLYADKEKQRARMTLYSAVRRGRIVKPTACERCGMVVPSRRLHGHHADYSKPLDVQWLCSVCHGQERMVS